MSWTSAPWEAKGAAGWWWSPAARGTEQEALGSSELEEAAGLQESSLQKVTLHEPRLGTWCFCTCPALVKVCWAGAQS